MWYIDAVEEMEVKSEECENTIYDFCFAQEDNLVL